MENLNKENLENVKKDLQNQALPKQIPTLIFFLLFASLNFYSLIILLTNYLNNLTLQGFVVVAINTALSYLIYKQVKK
jgi:uncharacterized membrane protein